MCWISVGDAASAMASDPFSSQGIITVLRMGSYMGKMIGRKLNFVDSKESFAEPAAGGIGVLFWEWGRTTKEKGSLSSGEVWGGFLDGKALDYYFILFLFDKAVSCSHTLYGKTKTSSTVEKFCGCSSTKSWSWLARRNSITPSLRRVWVAKLIKQKKKFVITLLHSPRVYL